MNREGGGSLEFQKKEPKGIITTMMNDSSNEEGEGIVTGREGCNMRRNGRLGRIRMARQWRSTG